MARRPKAQQMQSDFGPYYRSQRKLRQPGVSAAKIARKGGITPQYLSAVELGKVPPPSADIVVELADAIGMDRLTLLGKAGVIDPDITQALQASSVLQYGSAIFLCKLMTAGKNAEFNFQDLIAYLVGANAPIERDPQEISMEMRQLHPSKVIKEMIYYLSSAIPDIYDSNINNCISKRIDEGYAKLKQLIKSI